MRSPSRGRSRSAWIASAVGAIIGIPIGRLIYAIADGLVAMLTPFAVAGLVAILAIIIVVGLIAIGLGDRGTGALLILLAVSMGTGALMAFQFGDGIQLVSERPAQIEVTLDAPMHESFSGAGTCFTVPNGSAIRRVESDSFIQDGSTLWAVSMVLDDGDLPQHSVAIVPEDDTGRTARYLTGIVSQVEVDAASDRMTGSTTFVALQADPGRAPIGGPGGPAKLDGSVSWTCR